MKKYFVLFVLLLLFVLLFVPASASAPDIIIPIRDESSPYVFDYPVLPIVSLNSYSLAAFFANPYLVSYNSNFSSSTLCVYGGAGHGVGGFFVEIPPSLSSGNLYVYGVFPCLTTYASLSYGWNLNLSISLAGYRALSPFYMLSSTNLNIQNQVLSSSFDQRMPFDGSVYIPAHPDNYLYLYVYNPFVYDDSTTGEGAVWLPSAFITFVPDSVPVNYSPQLNSLVSNSSSSLLSLNNVLSRVTSIDNQLASYSPLLGSSEMEKFEDSYIENMQEQLDGVESMLSPENSALPNGGDFVGFASDIQDGLGVSGSSFNASEFADATSAFSGNDAIAAGGPWEFFSQSVADSLSGDTQTVGLSDDDYIYAWLEESQRRYGLWSSSSP